LALKKERETDQLEGQRKIENQIAELRKQIEEEEKITKQLYKEIQELKDAILAQSCSLLFPAKPKTPEKKKGKLES